MVRRKQAKPYHGTKENVDSIVNTTPLITEIMTLPKRPIPPLLRFGVLVTRSDNPELAKLKLIDDFDYQHEQGDDIQRSIQDMSLGDLRNILQEVGLKVKGKKQHLVSRLIGAQPKGRLNGNNKGLKDKSGKPHSPTRSTPGSRPPTPPLSAKEEEGNVVTERNSPEVNRTPEGKRDEDIEEEGEEGLDELSNSTSQYAGLKVTELRAELRKRGLNMMGRKEELADRLEVDDAATESRELASLQDMEVDGTIVSPHPLVFSCFFLTCLSLFVSVVGKKKSRRAASDEEDSQDEDDDDNDEYLGEDDGRGRAKRKLEPKKEKKGPGGHWRKKKRGQ
jgi:predicted HTH domain antitoxin